MKYSPLGKSGLNVSRVCLGTMTWGRQNTQGEAEAQIAYASEYGVNFMDTAELYAIPPNQSTYGATERIIGQWLSKNPALRDDWLIASKIAGNGLSYIRDGGDITGETVTAAIEGSLQRLQTDYIDLYQLHWPNRMSPHFGKQWPGVFSIDSVNGKHETEAMLAILRALDEAITAGKIRHWGLSDDTPWGIQQFLRLADQYDLPKPISIQNEFNLLHWKDWPYLIEQCYHSDIAYLPWSPLATGALTGKYRDGQIPAGSRWELMSGHRHGLFRDTHASRQAVAELCEIANDAKLSPATLALAWCEQVDGVTSTIIGATNIEQLKENLAAFEVELSAGTLEAIGEVIKRHPMPY